MRLAPHSPVSLSAGGGCKAGVTESKQNGIERQATQPYITRMILVLRFSFSYRGCASLILEQNRGLSGIRCCEMLDQMVC